MRFDAHAQSANNTKPAEPTTKREGTSRRCLEQSALGSTPLTDCTRPGCTLVQVPAHLRAFSTQEMVVPDFIEGVHTRSLEPPSPASLCPDTYLEMYARVYCQYKIAGSKCQNKYAFEWTYADLRNQKLTHVRVRVRARTCKSLGPGASYVEAVPACHHWVHEITPRKRCASTGPRSPHGGFAVLPSSTHLDRELEFGVTPGLAVLLERGGRRPPAVPTLQQKGRQRQRISTHVLISTHAVLNWCCARMSWIGARS